jgi:hypothetical protein
MEESNKLPHPDTDKLEAHLDRPVNIDELIESIEKLSLKSKDYIKFIIGLSTGALVLSSTLVKEFIKFPQYNFILIIALVCFFVSIISGVWIFPLWDKFQGRVEIMKSLFKRPMESLDAISKRRYGEQTLMNVIKGFTPPVLMEKNEIQDIIKLWDNYISKKELDKKHLKKLKNLFESISRISIKDEYKSMSDDAIKELFKCYHFFKGYEEKAYLPNLLKGIRRANSLIPRFELVMRYSFFVGMLAILVFAIINFIK